MRSYIAIIDRDNMPGVSIVFPDLPGCVSEADTLSDAPDRAREALALYAAEAADRGYILPAPSALDALVKGGHIPRRPSVLLVAVDLPAAMGARERVNVMLDKNLLSEIDRAAVRSGITRSGFLEIAARERILNRGDTEIGVISARAGRRPLIDIAMIHRSGKLEAGPSTKRAPINVRRRRSLRRVK